MNTDFIITYQTTIKAPVNKVWDALTKPEIVKQYFFGSDLRTDWEKGSPVYFSGEYEGHAYEDKGIVLEYVENQKLSYSYLSSWANLEDKPENYLLVSYEVKALENGTELKITQSNYTEEKAQHSKENWASLVNEMKKMVE